MSEKKNRRRWTAQKKLKLVLESMDPGARMADICHREGLAPNQLHQWRKQLCGLAEEVSGRKPGTSAQRNRQAERQQAEIDRLMGAIAEITAEKLDPRKTPSD